MRIGERLPRFAGNDMICGMRIGGTGSGEKAAGGGTPGMRGEERGVPNAEYGPRTEGLCMAADSICTRHPSAMWYCHLAPSSIAVLVTH